MTTNNPDRRTQPRVPVRVSVSIRSSQGVEATGQTRDLSTNGMFLYTDAEIEPGSELEMVLMLPPELSAGEKRWMCCHASVIRVENKRDTDGFGVAASIGKIDLLPEIPG